MNNEDIRPNPDLLLAALKKQEVDDKHGMLRIFFGMCAGVGKTYAMLEAAQALRKNGVDVVIGLVETHGRKETESLVNGIPEIPRQKIEYKGKTFEDFDLDAVLRRKPAVVLVDELAHTNIPGMRHAKRWQDVEELLDNGINVYTTMNIQHVESRKEDVELITGITIYELVPDSVLERADQIELVDLPPPILLERLREGKVYLGDKAVLALENFFKEDKLTALREIALRLTSDMVNNELRLMNVPGEKTGAWRTNERFLVAVSHSPYSKKLVRAARRIAFANESPWLAVNIQTGLKLSESDKIQLDENLYLARELGAEVINTVDTDVVEAIKRIVAQRNITQIIVGRARATLLEKLLKGGSVLDRLVRETNIDVHVLREYALLGKEQSRLKQVRYQPISLAGNYWQALWIILAVTIFNFLLLPFLGYQSIGYIYLLAVTLISTFAQFGPLILTAVLSALLWNFFFIPPLGTFHISKPEDLVLCLIYGITAIVTGIMSQRIRASQRLLRMRESRQEVLYDIVKTIALSPERTDCIKEVTKKLDPLLKGKNIIYFINKLGDATLHVLSHSGLDRNMNAVAKWVFENNKPAGWSTETLSQSSSYMLPLKGTAEMVGVLAFKPTGRSDVLTQGEKNLLYVIAGQIAVYLEKELYQERSQETKKLEESERLHQTILNSISHEIKTPMTAIIGLASALDDKEVLKKPQVLGQLLQELGEAVDRLNSEVNNILDMSRLSSGVLTLKKDWNELKEIIAYSSNKIQKQLTGHPVSINIPEQLPFVKVDFGFMESTLRNILLNAAIYTPAEAPIIITASTDREYFYISIADEGPGIPEEQINHIFEKFYRLPGSAPGGTGLGLTIAKSVIELHGGTITARNRLPKGLEVLITLPYEEQPQIPAENQV